jgi:hypothetical protein
MNLNKCRHLRPNWEARNDCSRRRLWFATITQGSHTQKSRGERLLTSAARGTHWWTVEIVVETPAEKLRVAGQMSLSLRALREAISWGSVPACFPTPATGLLPRRAYGGLLATTGECRANGPSHTSLGQRPRITAHIKNPKGQWPDLYQPGATPQDSGAHK